jgi:hypothetical protein
VAALFLGIAVAMRSFPMLLVPAFVLLFCRGISEVLIFLALSGLPSVLSSIPYMLYSREAFLQEAAGYGGTSDFGWMSVLRALRYFSAKEKIGAVSPHLIDQTKRLFLGAYVLTVLVLPFFRREALGRALLIAPLLFFGLYGGVAAQYLIWIVPLAIALRERLIFPFTVVGTAALYCFYVMYHPGIVAGRHPLLVHESPLVMGIYTGANALIVLLSLLWVGQIIAGELRVYWRVHRADSNGLAARFNAIWRSPAYLGLIAVATVAWAYLLTQVVREGGIIAQALLR